MPKYPIPPRPLPENVQQKSINPTDALISFSTQDSRQLMSPRAIRSRRFCRCKWSCPIQRLSGIVMPWQGWSCHYLRNRSWFSAFHRHQRLYFLASPRYSFADSRISSIRFSVCLDRTDLLVWWCMVHLWDYSERNISAVCVPSWMRTSCGKRPVLTKKFDFFLTRALTWWFASQLDAIKLAMPFSMRSISWPCGSSGQGGSMESTQWNGG